MRSEFIQVQIINRESLLGLYLPMRFQNIKAQRGCKSPSGPRRETHTATACLSVGTLYLTVFKSESLCRKPREPWTLCCSIQRYSETPSVTTEHFLIPKRIETRLPSWPRGCLKSLEEVYWIKTYRTEFSKMEEKCLTVSVWPKPCSVLAIPSALFH